MNCFKKRLQGEINSELNSQRSKISFARIPTPRTGRFSQRGLLKIFSINLKLNAFGASVPLKLPQQWTKQKS